MRKSPRERGLFCFCGEERAPRGPSSSVARVCSSLGHPLISKSTPRSRSALAIRRGTSARRARLFPAIGDEPGCRPLRGDPRRGLFGDFLVDDLRQEVLGQSRVGTSGRPGVVSPHVVAKGVDGPQRPHIGFVCVAILMRGNEPELISARRCVARFGSVPSELQPRQAGCYLGDMNARSKRSSTR